MIAIQSSGGGAKQRALPGPRAAPGSASQRTTSGLHVRNVCGESGSSIAIFHFAVQGLLPILKCGARSRAAKCQLNSPARTGSSGRAEATARLAFSVRMRPTLRAARISSHEFTTRHQYMLLPSSRLMMRNASPCLSSTRRRAPDHIARRKTQGSRGRTEGGGTCCASFLVIIEKPWAA